ncbi:MAG: 23S rRNA (guanosine(2251)-2'-O)-methyltransferase RlmB [Bacteroidales bacterium]
MKETDFIFGIHPVREAIEKETPIDHILIATGSDRKPGISEILSDARQQHIQIKRVPVEKLMRVTRGNHQGVIAFIAPVHYYKLEDLVMNAFEKGITPLFLILDNITDVRNFGAMARSCDAAGVTGIVIPETKSVSVTADAVRASAGALLNVPVVKTKNMNGALKYLQQSGIRLFAASEKAVKLYSEADFNVPAGIILGSEEDGISVPILKISDEWIRIPMAGQVASLNVSVSAGIIVFEAVRQRGLVI